MTPWGCQRGPASGDVGAGNGPEMWGVKCYHHDVTCGSPGLRLLQPGEGQGLRLAQGRGSVPPYLPLRPDTCHLRTWSSAPVCVFNSCKSLMAWSLHRRSSLSPVSPLSVLLPDTWGSAGTAVPGFCPEPRGTLQPLLRTPPLDTHLWEEVCTQMGGNGVALRSAMTRDELPSAVGCWLSTRGPRTLCGSRAQCCCLPILHSFGPRGPRILFCA